MSHGDSPSGDGPQAMALLAAARARMGSEETATHNGTLSCERQLNICYFVLCVPKQTGSFRPIVNRLSVASVTDSDI